jgi:hypothetical protein
VEKKEPTPVPPNLRRRFMVSSEMKLFRSGSMLLAALAFEALLRGRRGGGRRGGGLGLGLFWGSGAGAGSAAAACWGGRGSGWSVYGFAHIILLIVGCDNTQVEGVIAQDMPAWHGGGKALQGIELEQDTTIDCAGKAAAIVRNLVFLEGELRILVSSPGHMGVMMAIADEKLAKWSSRPRRRDAASTRRRGRLRYIRAAIADERLARNGESCSSQGPNLDIF